MGIRPDLERKWSVFDEKNAARAKERQEWAKQAELRYQERMKAFRERAMADRIAYLEQERVAREDSQMITQMIDALCNLDTKEKEEPQKKPQPKKTKDTKARVKTKVNSATQWLIFIFNSVYCNRKPYLVALNQINR